MSGKSRVRRTRRTNTHDEDHAVKLDDSIDQSDDNKSVASNDTEKLDSSLKEETNGHDTPKNENRKEKDINKTAIETSELPTVSEEVVEKSNGQTEVIAATESSSTEKLETLKNGEEQSSEEMEPLSVDSEDPELQFTSEQNSDKSSEVEMSPTLIRCRTRRSHTRNMPTPKTPKVLDIIEDIEQESSEKTEAKSEMIAPEIIITIADDVEENSEDVSLASNISIDGSIGEKTLDSDFANASTFVNLGNDTTKNFDITVQSNLEEGQNVSNFLETTKDKSYGETLRCLTGRKTARNYNAPPRMYSSTIELNFKDFTDSSKKYSPFSGGVKRKLDAEMPSDKRMRTEDVSPGILSYLTSPFKNKIAQTEVPSSTPKLTSFKYVHHGSTVIDEVSKIGLENDEKQTDPKKWCSIM